MLDRLRDRSISHDELPFWNNTSFLKQPNIEKRFNQKLISRTFATPVNPNFYIDQFSTNAFIEFDGSSQTMREHGCGIVSLHHILGTLIEGYENTVGELAAFALSFHRNDLLNMEGRVIKKGTPVLAKNIGWYHDALLHTASQFEVKGHRIEGVELIDVAKEYASIVNVNTRVLSIISVKDNYKRPHLNGDSSHLVVASGFKFNFRGNLSEIMITDPNVHISNGNHINEWVKIDRMAPESFLKKAMFFYTDK